MRPIIVSLERLSHLQCPECMGWWSIGDMPDREFWFCTWCGIKLPFDGSWPILSELEQEDIIKEDIIKQVLEERKEVWERLADS